MGRFCKRTAVHQQTTYQIREKRKGKQNNRRCRVNFSKIAKMIAYSVTISSIFVDQLMTQLKWIFPKKEKLWRQCIFSSNIFHDFYAQFQGKLCFGKFWPQIGIAKGPPAVGSRESNLWMKRLRPRSIYTHFHNLISEKARLNILVFFFCFLINTVKMGSWVFYWKAGKVWVLLLVE